MCQYDYDQPDFHSEKITKARKEHRCWECYRMIQPGELYETVTGKWDGTISTYKTCPHCLESRRWLEEICHSWVYGMVAEDLYNHADEFDAPSFIELTMLGSWMCNKWVMKNGKQVPVSKVKSLVKSAIKRWRATMEKEAA